jgi:hypothetical protein
MEIDLRIADDYCQGDAETLEPLYDDEYYEDRVIYNGFKIRLRKRNG